MGYAVKFDGQFRSVTPEMALAAGETYSETLPEPQNEAQAARQPAVATMQSLQRELALAGLSANQPAINRIKREISRLRYISPGV